MPDIAGQSTLPRASAFSKEYQVANTYDLQVPVALSL
jgi:hypothetical protein